MYWKKGPSREGKADIKYGDPFEWDDLFVEARVYVNVSIEIILLDGGGKRSGRLGWV